MARSLLCNTKKYNVALKHWFSTGGPQHVSWVGHRFLRYFNNEFASRMRLSNSGAYGSPYGPAPMNGKRNDLIFLCKSTPTADWPSSALGGNESFFLEITSATMRSDANPSNFVTITSQTESKWATVNGKSWPWKKPGHKDS